MKAITVIGGGLSGLALGIVLRKAGVPVTVHEAGRLPRHRVCGEFITGLPEDTRASLELEAVLGDALVLEETLWYVGDRPVLRRTLPGPAFGLSRFALDQRLAERFTAAGGNLCLQSRYTGGPAEGVVYTSGRRPETRSPWLGLKAHFSGFPLEAELELHLSPGGYAGASPVEDGMVNVCGLFRRRPDIRAGREAILQAYLEANGLLSLADRIENAITDLDSCCSVAGLDYAGTAPAACASLGDRLALIPPFTGHGMALALESGVLAGGPITDYASGRLDWPAALERMHAILTDRFRRRLYWGRTLHRLMLRPVALPLLGLLARSRLLPFKSLYRLTHG